MKVALHRAVPGFFPLVTHLALLLVTFPPTLVAAMHWVAPYLSIFEPVLW